MHKIVKELKSLIQRYDWTNDFCEAIRKAQSYKVPQIAHIRNLNDYLEYINELVTWTPKDTKADSRLMYDKIVEFYFFLDQPALKKLQSPLHPELKVAELSPLSRWIVEFAEHWGSYLDTPESAQEVEMFKSDPHFNWGEYMPPPSGYLTFNQFFARHVKPGMRPIAGLCDNSILVSPADSTFVGWWRIGESSQICVDGERYGIVESKGIRWSIRELLKDSVFADRFKGGIFTHSILNVYDYHRWHSPVQGKIVEAKLIQGQAYLDVRVKQIRMNGQSVNQLTASDGIGYQFVQTRGLVIIDSPIGLVACLPMGMSRVTSVRITAEAGISIHKGEELGYFQFGGSDFVMVFERAANVQLLNQAGAHVQQGACIGNAYPYQQYRDTAVKG